MGCLIDPATASGRAVFLQTAPPLGRNDKLHTTITDWHFQILPEYGIIVSTMPTNIFWRREVRAVAEATGCKTAVDCLCHWDPVVGQLVKDYTSEEQHGAYQRMDRNEKLLDAVELKRLELEEAAKYMESQKEAGGSWAGIMALQDRVEKLARELRTAVSAADHTNRDKIRMERAQTDSAVAKERTRIANELLDEIAMNMPQALAVNYVFSCRDALNAKGKDPRTATGRSLAKEVNA